MNKLLRVLVGCEESQEVCKAFRALGHEAYSCDLQECSGEKPEWHLQMDVFDAIKNIRPDLFIGFPPCTRLTVTANKWYKPEFRNRFPNILEERELAKDFFMKLINAPAYRIAIENPVGIMSTYYRKPDQIIQPFYFGHATSKRTCLWLKNLPRLIHSSKQNLFDARTHVEPVYFMAAGKRYSGTAYSTSSARALNHLDFLSPSKDRARLRSKTFPGIAKAMAEQWGGNILQQKTA